MGGGLICFNRHDEDAPYFADRATWRTFGSYDIKSFDLRIRDVELEGSVLFLWTLVGLGPTL